MDPRDGMRAGDADREAVVERLRGALEEGRLDLTEYDERLREAYAARTYGELDRLLADLPGTVPGERAQVVPAALARVPAATAGDELVGGARGATARWLVHVWSDYLWIVAVCLAIWGGVALVASPDDGVPYFWPGWVAGPWGIFLVVQTVRGLSDGTPRRWAAKQARKKADKRGKRQMKGDN